MDLPDPYRDRARNPARALAGNLTSTFQPFSARTPPAGRACIVFLVDSPAAQKKDLCNQAHTFHICT